MCGSIFVVFDGKKNHSGDYVLFVKMFSNFNCLSSLKLWVQNFKPHSWWGVRDTTLCDKVCQWLVTGLWFSPGTLVSPSNKTDHHDITETVIVESGVKHHKPTYLTKILVLNTIITY